MRYHGAQSKPHIPTAAHINFHIRAAMQIRWKWSFITWFYIIIYNCAVSVYVRRYSMNPRKPAGSHSTMCCDVSPTCVRYIHIMFSDWYMRAILPSVINVKNAYEKLKRWFFLTMQTCALLEHECKTLKEHFYF